MSAKTSLSLSLDEIIKNSKKDKTPGKRTVRNGAKTVGMRKKGQGVAKRRSVGSPKKNRVVVKRQSNRIQANASRPLVSKVATQRLVSKLVKKALRQVTTTRTPRVGAIRNIARGRRDGVRGQTRRGQTRGSLNRVSDRSRVIGRRPQSFNRSANQARRGRRGGNRVVVARRPQNPIAAQLNFLRRQQQSQRPQVRAPVLQQVIQRQQRVPRASVQRRQPATRVIYVQQQQRPPPRRRQPQQIIYVQQQQPRRQFSRGGRGVGGRGRGGRRSNDPFYEPQNFLQRVPTSGQSFGRGGRFIEF